MYKVIGIDISKETFDLAIKKHDHWINDQLTNNLNGFNALLKLLQLGDLVVMEASGPYYLPLSTFLYNQGIGVSVVNPLVIRRYSQMQLNRAKTDKKDAQVIASYAMSQTPSLWKPEEQGFVHLRQMFALRQNIEGQISSFNNQFHAFSATGDLNKEVKSILKSTVKTLEGKKKKIEREMDVIALKSYEHTISRLESIPGIGRKTSTLLVVITNNFEKFESYKQLIAYVGLSPRIYKSGSSINGKGHICKMGNGLIRKYLYLCTWTAKFKNKGCVEMYKRLNAKGKPERVIKVALANKLLKQAFAIVKHNTLYDENYIPKPCF